MGTGSVQAQLADPALLRLLALQLSTSQGPSTVAQLGSEFREAVVRAAQRRANVLNCIVGLNKHECLQDWHL